MHYKQISLNDFIWSNEHLIYFNRRKQLLNSEKIDLVYRMICYFKEKNEILSADLFAILILFTSNYVVTIITFHYYCYLVVFS